MDGREMEPWDAVESISWDEIRSIVWSRLEKFAYSADDALLLFVEICEGLPHKMDRVRTLNLSKLSTSFLVPDKLGHRALSALVRIVKAGYFSKLQKLDLSGSLKVGEYLVEALDNVFQSGHWKQLQELRLSDMSLHGIDLVKTLANYAASGYLNELVSLDLSSHTIGHIGATALAKSFASGQFSKVISLNLSWNTLGDVEATALAESLTSGGLTNLQRLNLRGCNIGNAGVTAFVKSFASNRCLKLESLNLSENDLGDAGAEALCQSFKSSQLNDLRELSLNRTGLHERGAVALATLFKYGNLRKLETLELASNDFGVEGYKSLREGIASGHLSNIRTLKWSFNELRDDAVASLVNSFGVGHVSKMESLDLSGMGMGREGAISLARWLQTGGARNLRVLILSDNDMGDVGVAALASSLQSGNLSKLQLLDLSDNRFGRGGVEALALSFGKAQLSELTTLHLSNNRVVDEGVQPTERVSQSNYPVKSLPHDHDFNQGGATALMRSFQSDCWKKLTTLDLSSTLVDDEGIKALAEAIKQGFVSALQHLRLSDIHVGQNAMLSLVQAYGQGEWQGFQLSKKGGWTDLRLSRIMALPRPLEDIPGELITSRTLSIPVVLGPTHELILASTIWGQSQVLHISGFETETTFRFLSTGAAQWKRLRALVIKFKNTKTSLSKEGLSNALMIAFRLLNVSGLEYIRLYTLSSLEREVIIEEIVQALEAGTLLNLKALQLFDSASDVNEITESAKPNLVNCYQRNPYLVVRICAEELESEPGLMSDIDALRRANEERVTRLRELGDEPDESGKHGKVFLCGNEGVGKTTLRISLAKEETNSTANLTVHLTADAAINSAADSMANSATTSITNSAASEGGKKGRWLLLCQQGCMPGRRKRQSPTSETKMSNIEGDNAPGRQTPLSKEPRSRRGDESNMKSADMPGTSSPVSALPPTRGIEVSNIKGGGASAIQVALWDLAGQHEYQVLHSAFLPDIDVAGGQATFFVLVCGTDKTQDVSFKSVVYWLRFLSSNSFEDVQEGERRRRVFVVLNCFHGNQSGHNDEDWELFLSACQSTFGHFLNLHKVPFIFDATDADRAHQLKEAILTEANSLLEKRKMPQICFKIHENCENWIERHKGDEGYYPILGWAEFSSQIGGNYVPRRKLAAAANYLHEAGHLILFPAEAEASTSTRHLGAEKSLLIVDPTWFCRNVIGHLLLPQRLVTIADKFQEVWKHLDLENNPLPISTFEKWNFLVPRKKLQEVVMLMSRLGLCYQLESRSESVFIPALIKRNDAPGWGDSDWSSNSDQQAWVMGFSLRIKKLHETLLPIAVLRYLQVELAQSKCYGAPDCSYVARKCCIAFNYEEKKVLIEYPFDSATNTSTEDRIDILVKPINSDSSMSATNRLDQTNLAQEIVDRILSITSTQYLCVGVNLERRIVKPWTVNSGWKSLDQRDIQISVEDVMSRVAERGFGMMHWEEPRVSAADLLSEKDLGRYKDSVHGRYLRTEGAVRILGLSDFSKSEVIPEAPQNPDDLIVWRAIKELRKVLDDLSRDVKEIKHDVKQIKQGIQKIVDAQESMNVHLQNLERFSLEEKEVKRAVPRFILLKEAGTGRKWWIKFREKISKKMTLYFLCEAHWESHKLHEVEPEDQKGVHLERPEQWVKRLLPALDWTLRLSFVAAKIAGNVILPGLALALSDLPEDTVTRAIQMANGIPDLWKYISDTFEVGSVPHPIGQLNQSMADNLHEESSSGKDARYLNGSFELRGEARAAVHEMYNKLSDKEKQEEVGLTPVWLDDDHHVVWVCNGCMKKYGEKAHELRI